MKSPFDFTRLIRRLAASLPLCGIFAALLCGQTQTGGLTRAQAFARARDLSALGAKLFSDPSLSGSGRLSCASCHDPEHAYGPPNGLSVQFGGTDLRSPGIRAVPSLRYLQVIPAFTEHYFGSGDEGDDSIDNGPTGGLTWDGRVDRLRDQARLPLLAPNEMANASESSVVGAALKSACSRELRRLAGAGANTHALFGTILDALEAWQQNNAEFYPYSSKYDAYLAGKTKLSDAEARGLKLFTDPNQGNCASCHIATRGANGTPPQFTDYSYAALGVPRNRALAANSDPNWYDLGLCGPLRGDLRARADYCGRFMTPSLRNVATRGAFFHNGVFHTLRKAVEFYAERDSDPAEWYPKNQAGAVMKFDDLPARYRGNVENGAPFGRHSGDPPALSPGGIDDIVAFLGTLADARRPVQSQ